MKTARRFLSVLTAVTLLLTSVLFMGGFTLAAEEAQTEYTGQNYTRLEAETFAGRNLCHTWYDKAEELWNRDATDFSPNALTGDPNVNHLTTNGRPYGRQETLISDGYIDASRAAYVEYFVDAASAGEYDVYLGFQWGGGKIAASINGGKPFDLTKDIASVNNGTTSSKSYKVTVDLVAGRNSLIFTFPYDTSWGNHDFLDIPETLTGVAAADVKVNAADATVINRCRADGTGLGYGEQNRTSDFAIKAADLNADKLREITFASLTVEAPKAGYYGLSLTYGTSAGTDGAMSSVAALVNGFQRYELRFNKSASERKVEVVAYLEEGLNTVAFTGIIASDSLPVYPWTNMRYFNVYGGLRVLSSSDEDAINPSTYYTTRMEAETYAIRNLYGANNDNNASLFSGGVGVGVGNYSKMQTFDDILQNGLDKTKTPYVQYEVYAPAAGEYEIGPAWFSDYIKQPDGTPTVFLIVNNNDPVRVLKQGREVYGQGASTSAAVKVSLSEGRNVIRVTGGEPVEGLTAKANHDYLYIENSLTPILISTAEFETIGAQKSTSAAAGMRFITSFESDNININAGTVILEGVTYNITEAGTLLGFEGDTLSIEDSFKYKAEYATDSNGKKVVTASVTNIDESLFDTGIQALGYIQYVKDDETVTVYAKSAIVRTVNQLAD